MASQISDNHLSYRYVIPLTVPGNLPSQLEVLSPRHGQTYIQTRSPLSIVNTLLDTLLAIAQCSYFNFS